MNSRAPSVDVRRLVPSDALAFQALRLAGLQAHPEAFGSTYEEEKDWPVERVRERLAARTDGGVFGAFENERLIGVLGLGRGQRTNFAHVGFLWGLYVHSDAAGRGVGRALVEAALALARSQPGLRHVTLQVSADNRPAIALYQSFGFVEIGREPDAMRVGNGFQDELRMYLPIATR
ncbi:GNAT family N-acetyltransferase [Pandoraea communis]|uniref:GNAT family N-acetyltransferase n=1 Tax=Pandoraea communis TaxID=2508297 RepID=A0A5E4WI60_9BURK|nr:GNAT family N-acetyltransferase [Pandoraea communis]MDM8358787.1 GNAT family N-acetyltransferase [Pandoraea communis]VVE24522.1 GNAT family N-acetyltransferase [Pandoraea communis]